MTLLDVKGWMWGLGAFAQGHSYTCGHKAHVHAAVCTLLSLACSVSCTHLSLACFCLLHAACVIGPPAASIQGCKAQVCSALCILYMYMFRSARQPQFAQTRAPSCLLTHILRQTHAKKVYTPSLSCTCACSHIHTCTYAH